MKLILILLVCLSFGQSSIGQSDSVFLSIESKLISQIQIIIPNGENAIRENYTHFKSKYWLNTTDTVSLSIVNRVENDNSKKKQVVYNKVGICDSTINTIRNNAQYWKMRSEVNKIAELEIGSGNKAFGQSKSMHVCSFYSFAQTCKEDFKEEIITLREQMFREIQLIKESKIKRYNSLKSNPTLIDSETILSFLRAFDNCEIDFKSAELIILNQPERFITEVHKLNDFNFPVLTYNLNNFPENAEISKMKASLRSTKSRSKRKRQIIRKMKRK